MTTNRSGEGAVAFSDRVAGLELQVMEARNRWSRDWEERWINGDDVPDVDHFIALWIAERACPPASIPAAEVQALVERLREQANESDRIADTFDDPERRNWYQGRAEGYEAAADNLALLIPRNPE